MRVGIDARPLSRQLSGIGYYTLHLVKELSKAGVETVLFSPSPLTVDLSGLDRCSIVCKSFKRLATRQIWSEFFLPFLLKKFDLDVFWGPAHRLPFWLPHNVAGVVTIHDVIWKRYPETMRKSTRLLETAFMPGSVQRADLVIADSRSTAADLLEFFGLADSKIRIVPLAPRLSETGGRQSGPLLPGRKYFLFVGTREPRKNLSSLIEAFGTLSEAARREFSLIIAGGDGWGNVSPAEKVAELGLQDCITVKQFLSEAELVEYYKQAYCLVMPSLYEGYGLPILEAQSFGVPVITSNVSSMPEVAGEGAVLVDPHSVESILVGLEKLIVDEALREDLSLKARENAGKYSWAKTAELTASSFEEAISLKNGNAHDINY